MVDTVSFIIFIFNLLKIIFFVNKKGSVKPGANTDIYIPSNIWLVVDYPLPPILSLRIDGVLEFEQVRFL